MRKKGGCVAKTYVVPDGHDKNHGYVKSVVELVEAANLLEAVTVTENAKLGSAVLGGDVAFGGETVDLGAGDLNLLAVLDEELSQLVLGELSNNARGIRLVYHRRQDT